MTQIDMTSTPQSEPDESVTEFEVGDDGTLRMTDCDEAETRAEFYDSVASFWSPSPKDLAEAMDECQPLAWAVHSIYADFRDELAAELAAAKGTGSAVERKLSALKVRLEALPEEPEEGAAAWLLSLTGKAFEDRVVPEVEKWFEEPPNWRFEDDYLPASGTAQGAALGVLSRHGGRRPPDARRRHRRGQTPRQHERCRRTVRRHRPSKPRGGSCGDTGAFRSRQGVKWG